MCPLTAKGKEIMAAMTKPKSKGGYGPKKGKSVFYASASAGKITGVHGKRKSKKKKSR